MAKPFGTPITKCPKCGAAIGDAHPYTWCVECGEPLPQNTLDELSSRREKTESVAHPANPSDPVHRVRDAVRRYTDGYTVARAVDGSGDIVKVVGIVFGVLVALLGFLVAANTSAAFGFAGLAFGAGVAIPLYVLGTLLSAVGQLLKATLDTAVHTSPFLDDQQKASAMSLK